MAVTLTSYSTDYSVDFPSFSHNNDGDFLMLFSCIFGTLGAYTSNQTYAAAAFTSDANSQISSNAMLEVLHIDDPATGVNTVSYEYTTGAAPTAESYAVSWSGVKTLESSFTNASTNSSTDGSYTILGTPAQSKSYLAIYSDNTSNVNDLTTTDSMLINELNVSNRAFFLIEGTKSGGDVTVSAQLPVGKGFNRIAFVLSITETTARSRSIAYFMDINDPYGRIYDATGRAIKPWEIKSDSWIRVSGLFLPTSTKYDTFTQDPELAYIEEVSFGRGGLRIKTSRGELTEVLLARAAGGKTL